MSHGRHTSKVPDGLYYRLAPFGNLQEMSNRSIMILDRLLLFYAADAVIRIGGIRNPEELPSWRDLYDEALAIVGQLQVIDFPKLVQAGYDPDHVRSLAGFCLDGDVTKQYVRARLSRVPMGEKWLRGELDTTSDKGVEELLWFIYNKALKAARAVGAGKVGKKVLANVRPPIRPEYQQNEALLILYEILGELEAGEDPELPALPMSPLAKQISIEPWDRVAPEIMQGEVGLYAGVCGPILDGKLDNIGGRVFHRLEELQAQEAGEHNRFEPVKVNRFLPISDELLSSRPAATSTDALDNASSAMQILDEVLNVKAARKPDRIRRAFALWARGMDVRRAAKMAGISRDTLHEYLKEMKNKS